MKLKLLYRLLKLTCLQYLKYTLVYIQVYIQQAINLPCVNIPHRLQRKAGVHTKVRKCFLFQGGIIYRSVLVTTVAVPKFHLIFLPTYSSGYDCHYQVSLLFVSDPEWPELTDVLTTVTGLSTRRKFAKGCRG